MSTQILLALRAPKEDNYNKSISERKVLKTECLPFTRVPSHLAGLVVVSGVCVYLAMPVLSS